ncbi:hypothetical protein [Mycoplasma hafezii]|uniref:hypothetical protein n=1 Tax=Mycoplasma hafezii TaxID=525886 RepID=UPI003CE76DDE
MSQSKNHSQVKTFNKIVAAVILIAAIISMVSNLFLLLTINRWDAIEDTLKSFNFGLYIFGTVCLVLASFVLLVNIFGFEQTKVKQENKWWYFIFLFLTTLLSIVDLSFFSVGVLEYQTALLALCGITVLLLPMVIFTAVAELRDLRVSTIFNFKNK